MPKTREAPKNDDRSKRVGPLDTIDRVRLQLVQVYREARNGEITTMTARDLTVMLKTIAGLIESGDIEKRLEEVEKVLAQRSGGRMN